MFILETMFILLRVDLKSSVYHVNKSWKSA